jgi:hypothetical protein
MTKTFDDTTQTAAPSLQDAALITSCEAVLTANAAFHGVCEAGTEPKALNNRRLELLTQVLALRATTPEGVRAKAEVVGAFYYWTNDKEAGCDLVASLLLDLGVIVPYGIATA